MKIFSLSGFGVVDLVEDSKTHKYFALKRVCCHDKKELETFSQENKYYKLLNNNSNIGNL